MYQIFQVKPIFSFVSEPLYSVNSTYILPTNIPFLLALFNSKLGWYQITQVCTSIQNGYQLIWEYFSKFLLPPMTDAQRDTLAALARERMDCAEPRASALDAEIDALVYELYDLTAEEIAVVEGRVG